MAATTWMDRDELQSHFWWLQLGDKLVLKMGGVSALLLIKAKLKKRRMLEARVQA
jgi:hypothetical protein